MSKDQPLIWMDLEMTGLDPEGDRILEIAVIVTSGDLETLDHGPDLVIHQSDARLEAMDAWNTEHHGASGLTERVRASALDEAAAEREILDWLKERCPARAVPLAGNSVHQDRAFLRRYMPDLHGFLHYRNVDVSTIKELLRRWAPEILAKAPSKKGAHRAMGDLEESIRELAYYRAEAFGFEAES